MIQDNRKVVYVVPHKNPDLDSIVSAYICAYILNQKEGRKDEKSTMRFEPGITEDFNPDKKEEFEDILNIYRGNNVSENRKLNKIFKKIEIKDDLQVVLVDHYQEEHFQDGIEFKNIIGIFDHHIDLKDFYKIKDKYPNLLNEFTYINKTGANVTNIHILARKWRCLSNLKAKFTGDIFMALVSDTNGLRSYNITRDDIIVAEEVAARNYRVLSKESIEGPVSNLTALVVKICNKALSRQLEIIDKNIITITDFKKRLNQDYKTYTNIVVNFKIGISTIKTSRKGNFRNVADLFINSSNNMREALKEFMKEKEIDFLYIMQVNLATEEDFSILYFITRCNCENYLKEPRQVEYFEFEKIKGLNSRKSQLVPYLMKNGISRPVQLLDEFAYIDVK